jgi:hypothetical protein
MRQQTLLSASVSIPGQAHPLHAALRHPARSRRPLERLPSHICIRQHTAYVSIRQHTSAYVSIRQRTSAYVSIRERRPLERLPLSLEAHRCALNARRAHAAEALSACWSTPACRERMLQMRQRMRRRGAALQSGSAMLLPTPALDPVITRVQHTSAYVSIRQHTSAYVSVGLTCTRPSHYTSLSEVATARSSSPPPPQALAARVYTHAHTHTHTLGTSRTCWKKASIYLSINRSIYRSIFLSIYEAPEGLV